MIVDSHCHAWRRWPYDLGVPDPDTRGSVEALLYEMDANEVDRAAVVCARIGAGAGGAGHGNDDNNDYVAAAVARHPDRLVAIADVDCVWRREYHQPGAPRRLRETVERLGVAGFTHYVGKNDGWFRSDEGREFLAVAAGLDLVASLAVSPDWLADLREVVAETPTLPVLLHHLGAPAVSAADHAAGLAEVVACAAVPNFVVKVSGFHYKSAVAYEYPFADVDDTMAALRQAFGPHRLTWASDFPASRDHLTYRQSLEVVRRHKGFGPDEIGPVLGETMHEILRTRRPPG